MATTSQVGFFIPVVQELQKRVTPLDRTSHPDHHEEELPPNNKDLNEYVWHICWGISSHIQLPL